MVLWGSDVPLLLLGWSSRATPEPFRRNAIRTGLRALAFAIVIAVLSADPAVAGGKWCEDDPLISVNGRVAHVVVGFSTDDLSKLNGSITYYVVVAQSYLATTTVDSSMAALPTVTYVYAIADDTMKQWWGEKIKVSVFAHVPGKKTFATVTTVTDFSQVVLERKHGKSNTWVQVNFGFD